MAHGQYDVDLDGKLEQVKVQLTFMVAVPSDMSLEDFTFQMGSWAKEDPIGWIAARPMNERFPTEVSVTAEGVTKF